MLLCAGSYLARRVGFLVVRPCWYCFFYCGSCWYDWLRVCHFYCCSLSSFPCGSTVFVLLLLLWLNWYDWLSVCHFYCCIGFLVARLCSYCFYCGSYTGSVCATFTFSRCVGCIVCWCSFGIIMWILLWLMLILLLLVLLVLLWLLLVTFTAVRVFWDGVEEWESEKGEGVCVNEWVSEWVSVSILWRIQCNFMLF